MTVELTEQQVHLSNLLQQRQEVSARIESLQKDVSSAREYYFRVQGAIEYLQQTGTILPEPNQMEVEPAVEAVAEVED